ncbi:hypothetical protein QBC44DRAFT_354693 [Cladorrhinum sp. PSN332]|nr:hypothetical protein QBC44DRAFT_354693 [Cladorrhinum sp. PSN332]
MRGVGLEAFLEGLIPEIAYSGEKGTSITELLKIVRKYHLSIGGQDGADSKTTTTGRQPDAIDEATLEATLTDAEMSSARWAWDWLRSRPQILINGHKRWNRLQLSEVLALSEEGPADPEASTVMPNTKSAKAAKPVAASTSKSKAQKSKKKPSTSKKSLTRRPRIHPSEDLVWQTLTRHGVDYKRVPALEWACLQGIATAKGEGILQSDLRRLVDQDKRSLPKRTDSLARKGYIVKRTVVVQKMKTSKLWLIDFAPPTVEAETVGLDLTPATLSKSLDRVPWHGRWTGNNIDMDALGRTVIGICKAFGVMRYSDLRTKLGVSGMAWQMKTLAKSCQRFVDMGVLKYTAASFPGAHKVFKDCLSFKRDASDEEWERFLATGKKTSQYSDPSRHREPKPNALALYEKPGTGANGALQPRRIFNGWTPEKPLAQTVLEVIKSAGPEGASNPQVSVATVGYQHRRYLSSYLQKVAETKQPPHLRKFQVECRKVRTGKTSAYMYTATGEGTTSDVATVAPNSVQTPGASRYGFGAVRPKAFASDEDISISAMSKLAKTSSPYHKRKFQHVAAQQAKALEGANQAEVNLAETDTTPRDVENSLTPNRAAGDINGITKDSSPMISPPEATFEVRIQTPDSTDSEGGATAKSLVLVVKSSKLQTRASEAASPPETQDSGSVNATSNIDIPQEQQVQDAVLDVTYYSTTGQLKLSGSERTVTFLGAPTEGRKRKPFTITLFVDDLDGLTIEDSPIGDGKSLVLRTKSDSKLSPYIFRFNDEEPENQEKAISIQQGVMSLKKPVEEPVEEVPEPPASTRGRGRGRGRGWGRGRGGTRGRGRRGGAVAGDKSYVCNTCGKGWKNPGGLEYHQKKAQVPCNPTFDPSSVLDRPRKRRRMSPAPPSSVAGSEAVEGEDPGRHRKKRKITQRAGGKGSSQRRIRDRPSWQPAGSDDNKLQNLGFRGVGTGTLIEVPRQGPKSESILYKIALKVPQPPKPTVPNWKQQLAPSIFSGANAPFQFCVNDQVQGRSPLPQRSLSHSIHSPRPGAATAYSEPIGLNGLSANIQEIELYGSTQIHSSLTSSQPVESYANDEILNQSTTSQYPELPGHGSQSRPPVMHARPTMAEPRQSSERDQTWDQQSITRPFVTRFYDNQPSDAKRRTAQAVDIINHLLDNCCGVFPADKAVFYAVVRVFVKAFKNENPPTWKNCQAAVRSLENKKEIQTHTHVLKPQRGRMTTCQLLIRVGVDPHGLVPTIMLQKIREMHPRTFIPAAFSPSPEELAALQDMDKRPSGEDRESKPNANGQKFRSRRRITEIQEFVAPFYTQNAATSDPPNEDVFGSSGLKRSATSGLDGSPSSKRTRTSTSWTPTRPNGQGPDDIPVDPELMLSPSEQRSQRLEYEEDPDEYQPSVLDAIKAYSLLPAFSGQRRLIYQHRSSKTLRKIPPELGRVRNPGLGSLPRSFFEPGSHFYNISLGRELVVLPSVQFLDPNAHLFDQEPELETNNERSAEISSSPESAQELQLEESDEETRPGFREAERPKAFEFVEPVILEVSYKGPWETFDTKYFEESDKSYSFEGSMPSRAWQLEQNLPTDAEEMAKAGKAVRHKLFDWIDREYGKFCSLVDRCALWEQSQSGRALLQSGTVSPGKIFIQHSPPASKCNMRPMEEVTWSDDSNFNLETIPYDKLEDDDDYRSLHGERPGSRERKRRCLKMAGPSAPRKPQFRPSKLKLQPIKTARELTPYPKSPEDFLRVVNDESEELDWSSENVRLATFIVVTTLLGGTNRVVDWGLMLRLMPDQTISQLRHYWCTLKKDRLTTIVSLTSKFRKAFLKAYENNELPPIDFNNILAYDWKGLIKWTIELDGNEKRTLPASRKAMEDQYTLSQVKHGDREWREAYYHPQRSVFNRFQDATSEALSLPVQHIPESKPTNDMIVAMAWTRALCVTPADPDTTEMVIEKRNSFYPGKTGPEITALMEKAVEQLQRLGVISKSSTKWSNGRTWRFNTRLLDSLEKSAQEEKFVRAVEFKKYLDNGLRNSEDKKMRVTYMTNDGMIMALLNMQATGRIRIETTGQPNVPMGHEPGNYETRKYPKKYLHFRLDIVPTETYQYDDGEELTDVRNRIMAAPPPTEGPGGAIPAWCDVFGKVDAERWLKYLSAVLITLASRGSMRAEELVKTLKPVIMMFEAELIYDWAEKLGLLKVQIEGTAPALMEWWWMAVEVQREALTAPPRQRKSLPSGRPLSN